MGEQTLSPAQVWFSERDETTLSVVDFSVHEEMSSPFECVVFATSDNTSLDTAEFVGKGAAFRLHYRHGAIVWAGICREAELIQANPGGAAVATYRFVIVPPLERLKFRRNYRVFQGQTTIDIVRAIFKEWHIPHNDSELEANQHHVHEYRVQAGESDFDFVSRLLEEEGTSYHFSHFEPQWPPTVGRTGSDASVLFLTDKPEEGPLTKGQFAYRARGLAVPFADDDYDVFDVSIRRRMAFTQATVRDFDLRMPPHTELVETSWVIDDTGYEDFHYEPGAFRARVDGQESGHARPTPVADGHGAYRTLEAKRKLAPRLLLEERRADRLRITFKTSALLLGPGDKFCLGQNSTETHVHPVVDPSVPLLVIARTLEGTTLGVDFQVNVAVPAEIGYRPNRKTQPVRQFGVQSALVVGPADTEIHTDELGRVRVQFHWDRENAFTDQSSCWIRASQGWAGTGFGMLEVPRVGQEVLVAFYGGNPDQPVIVGRVYNMTNTAAFPLPREKTKSGFRTESTGHTNSRSRGYNELVFEDKSAHEQVILRAEHSLRVLVKGSESHDVGGARSTHIGGNDAVHVGERSELLVGTQAGVRLTETSLLMSTTHAHLLLDGDTLDIQADGNVSFHAGKGVYISSNAGTVWLDGTPDINLNPQGGAGGPAPAAAVLGPADGPGGGPEQPAPYRPEGTSKASPPLPAFPEVTLK